MKTKCCRRIISATRLLPIGTVICQKDREASEFQGRFSHRLETSHIFAHVVARRRLRALIHENKPLTPYVKLCSARFVLEFERVGVVEYMHHDI